jgi:putative transposase
LRKELIELAHERPRFGYRRLGVLLDRNGKHVNHKRLFRVYRESGLSVKRTRRKKLVRVGVSLPVLTGPNQEWSLDFIHDGLAGGRTVRVLSVVDNFTRECLTLEIDTSFASQRVTRILDAIIERRGCPQALRMDNGPELTSRHFLTWCIEQKIAMNHIQPGKPMQKAQASYCTSLEHSGMTDDTGRRNESFIPCAFLGPSRPGGSYRCSGLSV